MLLLNPISSPPHRTQKGKKWRSGASIPIPLACKASALPFELQPQKFFFQKFSDIPMKFSNRLHVSNQNGEKHLVEQKRAHLLTVATRATAGQLSTGTVHRYLFGVYLVQGNRRSFPQLPTGD